MSKRQQQQIAIGLRRAAKQIPCRTCGGDGEHPDEEFEDCPTCEGDGWEEAD